jgi:hypothetical protein
LPQNEIDKRLKETKLFLSYQNSDVDTSRENPFIKYSNGKIFRLTNTLKTIYFLELDTLEFISDEGLIFDEYISYNSYQIGEATIMQNLGLGSAIYPGTFGSVGFYASGRKKIYQRSYLKFHSIFPYLVGIYQISILLFKLFTNYFDGGRLNDFLFSRIIEEKEYEKFKSFKRSLLYDDLFKKIPNSNENENEIGNINENENEVDIRNSNSNIISNLNSNSNSKLNENENPNEIQHKNIEAELSISCSNNNQGIIKIHKTNNYSSFSYFPENRKKENNIPDNSKKKKENECSKKKLRNNFFPKQENTEHEKEKEKYYHRVKSLKKEKENEIENNDNSQGFVVQKKNNDIFNVKKEINKNKK